MDGDLFAGRKRLGKVNMFVSILHVSIVMTPVGSLLYMTLTMKKTPFYKPSIRDSTNLCRAWGVDKTDILHYSDSVITTCLSPIVKQITTGYAIDEMSFEKVSWFSSAVNGWTVSIISDTNGVFLVKSATHKPSDDTW